MDAHGLFLLAALSVIPPDLYRVGRLDRLGTISRFRHITWPYLRAAVLIIMVIVSVEVQRGREELKVTEAEVVYVGVDLGTPERKPKPLLG